MVGEDEPLGIEDVEFADSPEERNHIIQQASAERDLRVEKIKEEIRARKLAFQRCFRDGNASTDDVVIMRRVLDRFCRKNRSTFHADQRLHALAEGRREVMLLIDDYTELTVDDLFNKLA